MPNAQCQWVEWRVFFSKTWATRPDRGYIKIRRNQAQIRGDPASSQPYLARFSQIQPFPADFSSFGADFGKFNADLVSFYIFRRWFGRFQRFFFFLTNVGDFCSSSDEPKPTKQTRSPIELKTNLTNWRRRSVSGHSSFHPTPAGRVWAGSKIDLTRPMDSPSSIHDISIDVWVLSCFQ